MKNEKKKMWNSGPPDKRDTIEDYTTLGSPYRKSNADKGNQMTEVITKLDSIERNLTLLLNLLKTHIKL